MAEIQPPPPLPQPFTYCDPANTPVLLAQGAEARLYKTHFLNPSIPAALKVRPLKPYRHPILDRRLTRQRILQEARCMAKLAREGAPVPGILAADWGQNSEVDSERREGNNAANNGGWLLMEWIDGEVVRQVVNSWEKWMKSSETLDEREPTNTSMSVSLEAVKESEKKVCALLRKIGSAVGFLHKTGIIHGDLTTSNLVLRQENKASTETVAQETDTKKIEPGIELPCLDGEIVLIDFGLASQSVQDEDRAVDLYVLERAFASSHPRTEGLFNEVLEGYGDSFKGAKQVLKRLEEVRMRGRKRSMIG